jgi:hypothetical protein
LTGAAGLAAAGAFIAVPALAQPPVQPPPVSELEPDVSVAPMIACHDTTDEDFVRGMFAVHPAGGVVARHALAAGMAPRSLFAIVVPTRDRGADAGSKQRRAAV